MRLTVQNFRRCRDVQIDGQKPVQLLLGANRAGKSSILGAVQVALTGKHPGWITKQSEKLGELIREGAKKAEIEVDFAFPHDAHDGIYVKRVLLPNKQVLYLGVRTGDQMPQVAGGTTTERQEWLCSRLGLSLKQLSCLLDAGQFLAMDTKEQVGFLAGVSGAELTLSRLYDRVRDENAMAAQVMVNHFSMPGNVQGVELLDGCLKWATEERRNAKRVRDEKQTLLDVSDREAPTKPDGEEPADLQERTIDLDNRYVAAMRRAGEIAQADKAVTAADEEFQAKTTALHLAAATAEAAPRAALADAFERLEPLATAVEVAMAAQQEAIEKAGRSGAVADGCRNHLEEQKEQLASGQCPTCGREWGEGHKVAYKHCEEDLATAQHAAEAARTALDQAKASLSVADSAARPVHEEVTSLERQIQSLEDAVAKAYEEVGRASRSLERAGSARAALATPEGVEALQAELATLGAWADWKASQETLANLGTTISEQEKTVETWEWLVSKFGSGPGSYRSELLEGKLGALEAAVNEALIDLLDEEIVFPSGDTPLSLKGTGYTRPAIRQYLSGSQELRLQIALQYGLCKALGFPLLLVDCEAALDGGTTGEILGFCKNVATSWPGVQMLVAMAPTRTDWREHLMGETERPDGFFGPLPRRIVTFEPWADVWAVVDGKTERMTAEPEEAK